MARTRGVPSRSLLGSTWEHLWSGPRRKPAAPRRRRLTLETCETRSLLSGVGLAGISGTKFNDANGDGSIVGDQPLAGISIELYKDGGDGVFNPANDALFGATQSGNDGKFSFTGLDSGLYFLREIPGIGQGQTFPTNPSFYTLEVSGDCVFVHSGVVIDNFNAPDPGATYFINAVNSDPALIKFAGAGMVGGERDVLIDVLGAANGISASGIIGGSGLPGTGMFLFGTTTPGTQAVLQYDGIDADGAVTLVNAQGLMSDLTSGGIDNGIRIDFTDLQVPGAASQMDVMIRMTSLGGGTATFASAVSESPGMAISYFAPFASFGTAGNFSFTSITSIELTFNGVGTPDIDFSIDDITAAREMKTNFDFANATQSAGVNIEKLVNGQDADVPTGPLLAVGSTATFSYVVTNAGTMPLTNVVVVDDNGTPGNPADDFSPLFSGGDGNGNNVLDVGEIWGYSASRTVTAGQYTNISRVTANAGTEGPVNDSDPASHFGVVAGIDIEKFTNGQDADSAPGPLLMVGDPATFTYFVTNTGNVPLSNVAVVDDNGTPANLSDDFNPAFIGGDTNGNDLLDLTETWTYTANRIVTAGQYTNVGVVTGDAPAVGQVDDIDVSNHVGATAAIDIEKFTNGEDADLPTGPLLIVNQQVNFTYEVRNTGDLPLGNVVVVDDNGTPGVPGDDFNPGFTGGDDNSNSMLDVDEVWTYTANRTVAAGQYTNIAVVTADAGAAGQVNDSDASNHFGVNAGIDVEKATNGDDADLPTGPLIDVGGTANFSYVVTNTGDMPLSSVVLVDDNGTPGIAADDFNPTFGGGDSNGNSQLDVGETWTYTASRTVTAGQYTNIATVTANAGASQPVVDSDPSNHFGVFVAVDVEKLTNGDDADTPTGPVLGVGSTATFTYVVTNAGNSPLSILSILDDNGTPAVAGDDFAPTFTGGDDNANNLLDVGEIWTYEQLHVVTAGQYRNDVSVSAEGPLGEQVFDTDPSHHFGATPAIQIEKAVNGDDADVATGPLVAPGSAISFSYAVTNPGNVALANVAVLDDNGTPGNAADDFNPTFTGGDINGNNLLDLTETWTYTASHPAAGGQYTNIARATGSSTAGDASDDDPGNYFGVFTGIDIEKFANGQDADSPTGPLVLAGGTVNLTYVVTNNGNSPLSGVIVTDNNGTPGNASDDFQPTFAGGDANGNNLLDVGETWMYSFTRPVAAGQNTCSATVVGTGPLEDTVNDTDPANYFGVVTTIDIEKLVSGQDADTAPGPTLSADGSAQFTYQVTNTGNQPLSNVVVRDDNATPGNTADDFSPTFTGGDTNGNSQLDLGETWTYAATLPVAVGPHTNVAVVTATTVLGTQATDSDVANYVGQPQSGSIAGYVFVDLNKNNFRDASELPIQGVRVTLSGTNDLGQAVSILFITAADGSFSFPNLRPGTYSLTEQQPTNYIDAGSAIGTGIAQSGSVVNSNLLSSIHLSAGENGVAYRFGELGRTARIISKRSYLMPAPPKVAPVATYPASVTNGTAAANAVTTTTVRTSRTMTSTQPATLLPPAPPPAVPKTTSTRRFSLSSFLRRRK